jgi:hypothetical protein
MNEEINNKEIIFAFLITLKTHLSELGDFIEGKIIHDYNEKVAELENIYSRDLKQLKVTRGEMTDNVDKDGWIKIRGFTMIPTSSDTADFYQQEKLCSKFNLITKLSSLLLIFKKDIALLFKN